MKYQIEDYDIIDEDELRDAAKFIYFCPMSDFASMAKNIGVDPVWFEAQLKTYMMPVGQTLQ
jgi:hypothetical protein